MKIIPPSPTNPTQNSLNKQTEIIRRSKEQDIYEYLQEEMKNIEAYKIYMNKDKYNSLRKSIQILIAHLVRKGAEKNGR